MPHTIVYQLENFQHYGEAIGNDWVFYLHTQAGLARIESSIRPREYDTTRRVIGIVEEERGEITDTWWVSVIEKDATQDDLAASSKHIISMVVEPGNAYERMISVEVADTGRKGRNDKAILDFHFLAYVLEENEPVPSLDVEILPQDPKPEITYPTKIAGSLPAQFDAIADGVDPKSVSVSAQLQSQIVRGIAGKSPRENVLTRFIESFSVDYHPSDFIPQISIYYISNEDGIPFWSSQNSSQGLRTQSRIIDALNQAIPPLGKQTSRFIRHRGELSHRLLSEKLTGDFGPAATALADLIMELTEDRPRRVSINRDLYTRSEQLNWFTEIWHHAFFVDPTPFRGPDKGIWLVVWSDGWEE